MAGRLMRLMSPCTRIIGGRPDDRCRSEALFLTEKASNSEMSIYNPCAVNGRVPQVCAFASTRPAINCPLTMIMSTIAHKLQAVDATIHAARKAAGRDADAVK